MTRTFVVETMGIEPTTPCLQSRTEVVLAVVLGVEPDSLMPSRVGAFPQVSTGSAIRHVSARSVWGRSVPPRLDPLAISPLVTFAATSAAHRAALRLH